jgi:hypothetical protein
VTHLKPEKVIFWVGGGADPEEDGYVEGDGESWEPRGNWWWDRMKSERWEIEGREKEGKIGKVEIRLARDVKKIFGREVEHFAHKVRDKEKSPFFLVNILKPGLCFSFQLLDPIVRCKSSIPLTTSESTLLFI